MAEVTRKSELISDLARSREIISSSARGIGQGFHFIKRVETSFSRNKVAWIIGASLLGFALSKLPARTKKVVVDRKGRATEPAKKAVEAGLLVTALKFAFDLSRPLLTKWLMSRVATYAQGRAAGKATPSK